jgi:two-component system response regulator DesR
VVLWHPSNLLSKALATVLTMDNDDFAVVAESGGAQRFFDVASRSRPHVAVIDHALDRESPLPDTCARLMSTASELRVLLLLDRSACQRIGAELVKLLPAVGLVDVDSSPADLIRCVRRLAEGQPVLNVDLAIAALKGKQSPLTDREREVLRLTVHGEPIAVIAAKLFLSTGTVRNYLGSIRAKTGARTRIEAIRNAEAAGWI